MIHGLKHTLPVIAETIGDEGRTGSVVVNGSCAAGATIAPKSAGSSIRSASKSFVNSLIETAAIENAPCIRVNGAVPGVVRAGIVPADDATCGAMGAHMQPLWGRPGRPEEVASLVSYLMGDEALFIFETDVKADGLWGLRRRHVVVQGALPMKAPDFSQNS
jgi:3-oxoacyl-[acyl-carrier protein] reductase